MTRDKINLNLKHKLDVKQKLKREQKNGIQIKSENYLAIIFVSTISKHPTR